MSQVKDLPLWLFVSYGGGHVKALLPVAQKVLALGIARPVYLALTTAAASVRAAGIETLGFADFLQAGDERALLKGEELVAVLQVEAAAHAESVAYLGLSYTEMEQRLGAAQAAQEFRQFGRQSFLPLAILERVLSRLQPALVIASNSPRAERAAIQTARRLGFASACVVDLLGIWERDVLAQADYADALCVINPGVRQMLLTAGRPAAQVHVTGNPAFDSIHDPAHRLAGQRLREQAGWQDLHVCLYAASPEPASSPGVAGAGDVLLPQKIETALMAAVHENPCLALLVRRHPSQAPADAIRQAGHPRIRVAGPELHLHAALQACDEAVVSVSTVGVEASLAGKPVTQIRGSIFDHLSPFLALGVAQRELRLPQIVGSAFSSDFGSKVGSKVGSDIGSEIGLKIGSEIGSKVGSKVGLGLASAGASDAKPSPLLAANSLSACDRVIQVLQSLQAVPNA